MLHVLEGILDWFFLKLLICKLEFPSYDLPHVIRKQGTTTSNYAVFVFIMTSPLWPTSVNAQDPTSGLHQISDYKPEQLHVIDGLRLRSVSDYVRFDLRFSELSSIDTLGAEEAIRKYGTVGSNGAVEMTISKPIILDGEVIYSSSSRTTKLANVDPLTIVQIRRLGRHALFKQYGVKDRAGAVEITTSNPIKN